MPRNKVSCSSWCGIAEEDAALYTTIRMIVHPRLGRFISRPSDVPSSVKEFAWRPQLFSMREGKEQRQRLQQLTEEGWNEAKGAEIVEIDGNRLITEMENGE